MLAKFDIGTTTESSLTIPLARRLAVQGACGRLVANEGDDMDRRTLLQVGVPAAVAASIGVSAATETGIRGGTAAKPIRILFLDHAPRKQTGDRLYDPTPIERVLNSYANPGTKIEIGYPDNFDGSKIGLLLGEQDKLNGLDHLMAAPALIRKIFWAQENGYDAVIQSNTFDPGVEGGRLAGCHSGPRPLRRASRSSV